MLNSPARCIAVLAMISSIACAYQFRDRPRQADVPKPVKPTRKITEHATKHSTAPPPQPQSINKGAPDSVKSPSMTQCLIDRERIENNYQNALNKMKHRACTEDLECILLPAYTFCSSAVCLNRSSTVNRAYAKQVKDIQYQADLKACEQLTRSCAAPLYQKRLATTCSKNRTRAYCEQGQCVIKGENLENDRQ
ncbi:MAG: hypothetical protein ACPGQS_10855 [Bradymonadia bacterium]